MTGPRDGERREPVEPSDAAGTSSRFPAPPLVFRDTRDREIRVRVYDGAFDALLSMYAEYHPDDRAQGIPPGRPDRLRDWLRGVVETGHNVIALHDGDVVGHACLIPDGADGSSCELAIFVLRGFQRAGIGTELLKALLGLGEARGIETVWLCVERWNSVAVHLYRKAGFVTRNTRGFELEMELELA